MVMILEIVTTGGCNGVKLVIGQRVAKLSASCCKGIVKTIVRIIHLIDLEHGFQTSFVEAGIVGHKGNGGYLVTEIIDWLLVRKEYIGYLFFCIDSDHEPADTSSCSSLARAG